MVIQLIAGLLGLIWAIAPFGGVPVTIAAHASPIAFGHAAQRLTQIRAHQDPDASVAIRFNDAHPDILSALSIATAASNPDNSEKTDSASNPSPESSSAPLDALSPSPAPSSLARAPIERGSFVAEAVERIGPAVVRIDTERTITRRVPGAMRRDPFFNEFFGGTMMPFEQRLQGQGSGFIVDSTGIVLTNAHVVAQADRVTITLKDGRSFDGSVVGADELTDLAVVQLQSNANDSLDSDVALENLPVAPLGDSEVVRVGDWAIAVGNPLGLDNTVTLGIVSTLNRSSINAGIPDKRLNFIQTDAAINPGNSGGPLLDENGAVIGINTAIRANANGIGFAIPINKAKEILPRLVEGERIAHPYIGVQITELTPELAQDNNANPNSSALLPEVNGVLITGVMPNAPASESGLRRGDVIVEVDGQTITNAQQLQSLVDQTSVNQTLELEVIRGDRPLQFSVQTADRSTQAR